MDIYYIYVFLLTVTKIYTEQHYFVEQLWFGIYTYMSANTTLPLMQFLEAKIDLWHNSANTKNKKT